MSVASQKKLRAAPPAATAQAEWDARVQLAACYRLIAHFRMTDLIYTHISARVPGSHDQFLINPYGLMFDEITASNLVKIDLDGNSVGEAGPGTNYAGFVIHSAVHAARPDVACVLHTHTKAGMTVAALKTGLLPLNQIAMQFHDRVAYHDYEGIAEDLDERQRLVGDLGGKWVMILRNHGLLTCGRSAAEAFLLMYYLDKACELQIAAQSTGVEPIIPAPDVRAYTERQYSGGETATMGPLDWPDLAWSALIRLIDRIDPGYRN
jgi:ribulose-5-phosphate 4-epimerase/fuculose-1-phosphate aldolase